MKSWVLGEFKTDHDVVEAARKLREMGQRSLDIHSPVPVHGANEALGLPGSRVPLFALVGGLLGAATGYFLQFYSSAVSYPVNVGNRPPHAPLSFVPITFELGVLISAFSIFFGLLGLFGFPRPHHPVFEAEGFESASVDGLWLSAEVEAGEAPKVAEALRALGAARVSTVAGEAKP